MSYQTDRERAAFLRAYAHTYIKEEVQVEQLVRKLDPFRNFLEIVAQCNGEIINNSRIAEDIDVDTKTIQSYFSILEDTLLGFYLPAYHRFLRKQQKSSPKFFLFDCGVKKALERTLNNPLNERTYGFGRAFEHFIILELFKHNAYFEMDYRFSYFRTKENVEIDLIIDRPGKPIALVEIKSTEKVQNKHISYLQRTLPDFSEAEAFCSSRDQVRKRIGCVLCLHWKEAFKELGLGG